GVFQAKELIAVFEGAFDSPTTSIGRQDLAGVPVQLGAVEHSVRALALEVMDENDGEQALAAGLVIEGLLGLDLQTGVEAELIEGEFRPGLRRVGGPLSHAG